jgi:hypothetical protein
MLEDDLQALVDAAGFRTPPLDVEGAVEAQLDVDVLRQHLQQLLATGTVCSGLEEAAAIRTQKEHLSASDDGCPIAQQLHSGFDVLRVYSTQECATLVVSFSGVSPGMGGISRHEFVGTCKRIGAADVLFLRGVMGCSVAAPSSSERVLAIACRHRMPSPHAVWHSPTHRMLGVSWALDCPLVGQSMGTQLTSTHPTICG